MEKVHIFTHAAGNFLGIAIHDRHTNFSIALTWPEVSALRDQLTSALTGAPPPSKELQPVVNDE